jgi:hypothetical protein
MKIQNSDSHLIFFGGLFLLKEQVSFGLPLFFSCLCKGRLVHVKIKRIAVEVPKPFHTNR